MVPKTKSCCPNQCQGHGLRKRSGCYAFVACLIGIVLVSCSPGGAPYLETPDLVEQLANADLSEPLPREGKPRTEYASGDRLDNASEKYPGTDLQLRPRPQVQGLSKSGENYELNFKEADLAAIAQVILRDTLNTPYVYDPRVKGRVTVSTGGPVSRQELLTLLETLLDMNGGVLIDDGSMMRIAPRREAGNAGGMQIDYRQERDRIGAGYGISIVPLRFVSAQAMLRMLRSFGSERNEANATIEKNLIVVRGSARERMSLVDVATMFDVDWMKGQSAGIYVVQNATPSDIIAELEKIFQTKGQGQGLVRFEPITRMNAILALTQKADLLDRVEVWVERLDREGVMADGYFVYRIEHGKANDLANLLNQTFGGAASGGSSVRAAEESSVTPTEGAVAVSAPAQSFNFSGGNPNDRASDRRGEIREDDRDGDRQPSSRASTSSRSAATPSGKIRVVADEINNRLLIRAPGRIYRKMLSVLQRVDQPPLQVVINATLAEVELNEALQYGVQFYLQKKGAQEGLLLFSNADTIALPATVPGLNFVMNNIAGNPRVVLDAIASQTAVRIVSSPTIVVLHNQEATLQVGEEVAVATRQSQSIDITPGLAPIVSEVQYRDTGVILRVKPRINSSGLVTMEIAQEVSSVQSDRVVGGGTLTPTFSQRRITSTIAVQDGQMVVLGGLINEFANKDKSRIPIVGRIPYLGDIVGHTDRGKTRTELIVFLRPRIIRKPHDASLLAQELRGRMQSLAPRRAPWDEDAARSPIGHIK